MSIFLKLYQNHSYDSRFLSIGRILIAFTILIDLIFRFQNIEAHYSNNGVLPVSVIKLYYPFYQYYFSIHNYFDSILTQKVLFVMHILFVIVLLLGYKTKIVTIFNYILLLSLHRRNPLILQGGDDLLRITLFYMIFLPWGRFYSIDFLLKKETKNDIQNKYREFSWVYVLFTINVGFVYLFSALLKWADEWRITGDAIYYALSLDTLRTNIGDLLYPHYPLLKILTFIVYYYFEILVPILLILSPTIKIRHLAALSIIVLHLGILFTLKVGIFPFVGIGTAIMLLSFQPVTINLEINKSEIYFATLLFILLLRYNLATLETNFFSISLVEDRLLNSIGLGQRWNMFSPGVKRYDGWLILRGIKKDNTEWDLIHNSPHVQYEKTEYNFYYLKGDRWRKFLENYEQTEYNFIKPFFCYYLIQQWNKKHPENTIEALNILFRKKITLPNYQFQLETENLCLCNPTIDKHLFK